MFGRDRQQAEPAPTEAEPTSSGEDESGIAALAVAVDQLRDLFVRRLRDDQAKNALIETVQAQAQAATDLANSRALEPIVREVLIAVDRLRDHPTPEIAESVAEELVEVFARRGLEAVEIGPAFDPRVHQAVAVVGASEGLEPGSIVTVQRLGYRFNDRLLRPAQVTVAR